MMISKHKYIILTLTILICHCIYIQAQRSDTLRWSVKTNALLWATVSPNLSLETAISRKWSFDLSGSVNPFNFSDNRKWKHWQATAEARYWLKDRIDGHFLGMHIGGGEFNINRLKLPFCNFEKAYRYEGWMARAGISYGYRWNFSRHWGMEAEVGIGLVYAKYDQYDCPVCGELKGNDSKLFVAPTRLGVSLVYNLGKKSRNTVITEHVDTVIRYQERIVKVPSPTEKSVLDLLHQQYPFLLKEGESVPSDGGISIRYRLDEGQLDTSYQDNTQELENLLQCMRQLKLIPSVSMSKVTIMGYASPEGNSQRNMQLAAERAESLRQYILQNIEINDSQIEARSGGEDWQGLRELVMKSDMRLKDEVVGIIDHAPEADRKRQLQQLDGGRPWQSIKDVLFPQLRNACYINIWYKEK